MGKPVSNTKEFIDRATLFHNGKYDYSHVEYVTQNIPVRVICSIHGEFLHKPKQHLKYGCNKCAQLIRVKPRRQTQENIIGRAIKIHGDKYDYSKLEYIKSHQKVEIICSKHGSFFQTPHGHLMGAGCSHCVRKISKSETLWLDSLGISKELRYYKVCTKNAFYYADGFDPITNTVYEFNGDYYHGNPVKFNSNKFNTKTKCTFGELYVRTLKKEEDLKSAGFKVISIWEKDFLG